MPRGDKSAYTGKQKRQAEHIEDSERERGASQATAERIAWATVNKQDGGGKQRGSGRAPAKKAAKKAPAKKAAKKAVAKKATASTRSAAAKKAAATRASNAAARSAAAKKAARTRANG